MVHQSGFPDENRELCAAKLHALAELVRTSETGIHEVTANKIISFRPDEFGRITYEVRVDVDGGDTALSLDWS